MTFLSRGIVALIAAVFIFLVANLYVSGVPETEMNGFELAAIAPETAPAPETLTDFPSAPAPSEDAPGIGMVLSQLFFAVMGPENGAAPTQVAIAPGQVQSQPLGQVAGIGTPPTIAPPSAGGPRGEVARAVAASADYDAMAEAWRGWMQANEIETGAMAVILPDGTEYGTGMGRTADDVRPVMSMSKTITGLCVDQLLIETGLGWDTTLGDIASQMSAAGLTPRPWNEHITLLSLATHTSGLAPDLTQSNMARDTHGALGLHRRWAAAALQEDAITGTPGTYFYNNTNYAVLGVVVEALSGQSYAQACMDRIVTPVGITDAVIQGRFGSLSSYAGWEISAMDYARLARHWFAPDQPHMVNPRMDADGYSIGYYDNGESIRHTGRFCRSSHPTGGVSSLFIHDLNGTTISINWDACTQPAVRRVLIDQLLELL
ncbi:serine hydrolase [Gymnodinialimonas hymeniacidonis]|uniref:serine hydrolase n=1 Tax=Gymnodinialimonas hymeniacidonis TaxID=3126508 RepID=UPI0034C6861A